MADVTKIEELVGWGKGFAELYLVDVDYMVVSTIGELAESPQNETERSIVFMTGILGGYAVEGEETMAFKCNEHGEVSDWGEVAVANGSGSRQKVIDELEAM